MVSDSDAPSPSPALPRRILVVGSAGSTAFAAALTELARREKEGELADIVLVDEADASVGQGGLSEMAQAIRTAHAPCEVFLEGDNRPSWQKMNDEPWRQRRSRKMGR